MWSEQTEKEQMRLQLKIPEVNQGHPQEPQEASKYNVIDAKGRVSQLLG